jgi:hypothetical protein
MHTHWDDHLPPVLSTSYQALETFTRDITRLLQPVTGSNSQAATKVQAVLSATSSKANALKTDVQRGVKTAPEAADELLGIVKGAFDELRSLLLGFGTEEASATVAGVAAEAAAAISDALARDRPVGTVLQLKQVQVKGLVRQGWLVRCSLSISSTRGTCLVSGKVLVVCTVEIALSCATVVMSVCWHHT